MSAARPTKLKSLLAGAGSVLNLQPGVPTRKSLAEARALTARARALLRERRAARLLTKFDRPPELVVRAFAAAVAADAGVATAGKVAVEGARYVTPKLTTGCVLLLPRPGAE
jgi:hypothetical protein